jgi:hypothetical protein
VNLIFYTWISIWGLHSIIYTFFCWGQAYIMTGTSSFLHMCSFLSMVIIVSPSYPMALTLMLFRWEWGMPAFQQLGQNPSLICLRTHANYIRNFTGAGSSDTTWKISLLLSLVLSKTIPFSGAVGSPKPGSESELCH